MNEPTKKTSPWIWVGVGCLAAVALFFAVLVLGGWYAVKKAKDFEKTMTDPVAREAKVREVLAAEKLPEGYFPVVGLSIPFLMNLAILSDRPPAPGGDTGGWDKRGFIYFDMRRIGDNRKEVDDFFSGQKRDLKFMREGKSNMNLEERIAEGEFELGGGKGRFVTHRGSVSGEKSQVTGLVSVLDADCNADDRIRIGIWFGPDPRKDQPEAPLTGSNADPKQINELMAHFAICRGKAV